MEQEPSFAVWLEGLRQGEEEAAREVFQRFCTRLMALARSRLDGRLRPKLDAEDIVQSVFKSFFPRLADQQFELESWDSLWSLLTLITLRKCGRRLEHFRAARRDVQREVAGGGAADDSAPAWEAVACEPTPSEAAVLAETVAQTLGALKDRERQIVELRLQGYTVPEIAAEVGRSEHTVKWTLQRVRERLQRLRDGDAAGA